MAHLLQDYEGEFMPFCQLMKSENVRSYLEIGSFSGGSIEVAAKYLPIGSRIVSVDLPWKQTKQVRLASTLDDLKRHGYDTHLIIGNSTDGESIAKARKYGPYDAVFIDGDHTFEGVLADVLAHWNVLQSAGEKPALAAFHDALPNDNFKWRDSGRRWKRFWIRFKNNFRKQKKPEIGPAYEPGILKVCDELIRQGLAVKWKSAASMLVLRKLADLPQNFSEIVRQALAHGS